jgi:hypothetical protein
LDEEIHTKEGIPPFGFGLEGPTKKEVSCIEEKDFPPILFHLGDKGGFLSDTAKGASKSPAGLDFTHHIIGINDAELCFRGSLERKDGG